MCVYAMFTQLMSIQLFFLVNIFFNMDITLDIAWDGSKSGKDFGTTVEVVESAGICVIFRNNPRSL